MLPAFTSLGESCTEILLYSPAKEGQIHSVEKFGTLHKGYLGFSDWHEQKTEIIPGLEYNCEFSNLYKVFSICRSGTTSKWEILETSISDKMRTKRNFLILQVEL